METAKIRDWVGLTPPTVFMICCANVTITPVTGTNGYAAFSQTRKEIPSWSVYAPLRF